MPISFATLQIFDQYLTTYGNKRNSRYDTHDFDELRKIYGAIQKKNSRVPLYLTEPTKEEIEYALRLKENATNLYHTIHALSDNRDHALFSVKKAYSSAPELVDVQYDRITPDSDEDSVPDSFELTIQSFATPQINRSSYLTSDQSVELSADNYSFDILTNKLHYELQFQIKDHETNQQLQEKIIRLVNQSDIGLHASLEQDKDSSAILISSETMGVPFQTAHHFEITDEHTSHRAGVVQYLGLTNSVQDASNAVYTVDGQEYTSYSNSFSVYQDYKLTLHPETADTDLLQLSPVEIGLSPDLESLSYNIHTFVDSYNHFIKEVSNVPSDASDTFPANYLYQDMQKLLREHEDSIQQYGIQVCDDDTLAFNDTLSDRSDADAVHTDALQELGDHILRRLHSMAIDPMSYCNRTVCAYRNPAGSFIDSYTTGVYSGMLFNSYC